MTFEEWMNEPMNSAGEFKRSDCYGEREIKAMRAAWDAARSSESGACPDCHGMGGTAATADGTIVHYCNCD